MKGMQDMMRQAQIMQKKIAEAQEALAQKTVEASSGGGMVTVVCTGAQVIQAIKIDPSAVDPNDVEMLQDLIFAAVNEALNKSREMVKEDMSALTGGMSIPGLF
jgi:DNA-binding YbaB/EbfC family protein